MIPMSSLDDEDNAERDPERSGDVPREHGTRVRSACLLMRRADVLRLRADSTGAGRDPVHQRTGPSRGHESEALQHLCPAPAVEGGNSAISSAGSLHPRQSRHDVRPYTTSALGLAGPTSRTSDLFQPLRAHHTPGKHPLDVHSIVFIPAAGSRQATTCARGSRFSTSIINSTDTATDGGFPRFPCREPARSDARRPRHRRNADTR